MRSNIKENRGRQIVFPTTNSQLNRNDGNVGPTHRRQATSLSNTKSTGLSLSRSMNDANLVYKPMANKLAIAFNRPLNNNDRLQINNDSIKSRDIDDEDDVNNPSNASISRNNTNLIRQVPKQAMTRVLELNANFAGDQPLSIFQKNKLMMHIYDLRREFPQPQYTFDNPIVIFYDFDMVDNEPVYDHVQNYNFPMLSPSHGLLQLIALLRRIRLNLGSAGADFVKRFQFRAIAQKKDNEQKRVANGRNASSNMQVAYPTSVIPLLFMVSGTSAYCYRDMQAAIIYLLGMFLYGIHL